MSCIFFDNITHWYYKKSIPAVKSFTLKVNPSELLCLIGPSGCGKSTLLNIAAAFFKPKEGKVFIRDEEVRSPGGKSKVVFQEMALFPWLTALANVEFGLKMKQFPKKERREAALIWLKKVGLEGSEDKYPAELSGGMKQRVALARALVCDPEVLLMDEPFGALDAQTRRILQDEVVRLWSSTKKTIFFVTHDVSEAVRMADRVAIMSCPPGTLKKIVKIDLERPREPVEVSHIAIQLEKVIEEEVRKMVEWKGLVA